MFNLFNECLSIMIMFVDVTAKWNVSHFLLIST